MKKNTVNMLLEEIKYMKDKWLRGQVSREYYEAYAKHIYTMIKGGKATKMKLI